MTSYQEFIATKTRAHVPSGIDVKGLHGELFDFQSAIVRWALRKGRACVFAGTGMGKTRIQCEWLRHLPKTRLIVAPLAVSAQTVREAMSIGMEIHPVRNGSEIRKGQVNVTNYDRIHLFDDCDIEAVVLDESSILKSHDGAYRKRLTDRFARTRFRLCCTATPSPNDLMELATHSEFVGAMTRLEMLATFFMHDGGDTSKWRLKRHAVKDFWKWVSTWAVCLANPEDLGFDGSRFVLPPLNWHTHMVDVDAGIGGGLFGTPTVDATDLPKVMRASEDARVREVACVAGHDRPVCVWCHYDSEQDKIAKLIPGAVSVKGPDSPESKEKALLGFADGEFRVLVTKPKIAGFGMNWQHCAETVFASVSFSFESQYQAVRRFYRFGQKIPVNAHIVCANTDESVRASVSAKAMAHEEMSTMIKEFCTAEVNNG